MLKGFFKHCNIIMYIRQLHESYASVAA